MYTCARNYSLAFFLAAAPLVTFAAPDDTHNLDRVTANHRVTWKSERAENGGALVRLQILAINDFHGQLSTGRRSGNRPAGSAAVLASYLRNAEAQFADGHTFIVHAGDQVSASPPNSALLQDEPSISLLNLLANKHCTYKHKLNPRCNLVGTLGNHEFDEGIDELHRLVNGGNHPKGPFLEDPWRGARFPYVCANVVDRKTRKPILPPYVIKKVNGVTIAFIGAVLKETPLIVTPTGVAGVEFLDEADAVNKYVPILRAKGVRAIVVLIHQGASMPPFNGTTAQPTADIPAPLGDIVKRLRNEIDVVVSGHSHGFTNVLTTNNHGKQILVTQAFAFGTAYAQIQLAIDPRTRDVVEKSASILTAFADEGPGLSPDPSAAALVAAADTRVAPLVNRVIGVAAAPITRSFSNAGETAIGNLVADAMRQTFGTQFAFMQIGGLRADLDAGNVTWGEAFAIQPFSNDLVRMDLTGEQISRLINQQWLPVLHPLQISGLTYVWDDSRPVGDKVIEVRDESGALLNPTATYTVTVNSFIAAGGDAFTVLTEGTNRVVGPVDVDALVSYIEALPRPFTSLISGRIKRLR
jgi:5'-nucleotidase